MANCPLDWAPVLWTGSLRLSLTLMGSTDHSALLVFEYLKSFHNSLCECRFAHFCPRSHSCGAKPSRASRALLGSPGRNTLQQRYSTLA